MQNNASSSAGPSDRSRRSRTDAWKCCNESSSPEPQRAMRHPARRARPQNFPSRLKSPARIAGVHIAGWPPRTSRSTAGSGSRGSTMPTFTTDVAGRTRRCSGEPTSTTSRSPNGSDFSQGDEEMISQVKDSDVAFRYTAEQAAQFRQRGWWGDEILLDRLERWTEDSPDRELVTDGVGRLTYGHAPGQAYRLPSELL